MYRQSKDLHGGLDGCSADGALFSRNDGRRVCLADNFVATRYHRMCSCSVQAYHALAWARDYVCHGVDRPLKREPDGAFRHTLLFWHGRCGDFSDPGCSKRAGGLVCQHSRRTDPHATAGLCGAKQAHCVADLTRTPREGSGEPKQAHHVADLNHRRKGRL